VFGPELLFCDLLSIELFDIVGNLEPGGVICELLQLFLSLFVQLMTRMTILYVAIELSEFLGVWLYYSLKVATNQTTFCLLLLFLCLSDSQFRELLLFLNCYLKIFGASLFSLEQVLERLDLRESKHLSIELRKYLLIGPFL